MRARICATNAPSVLDLRDSPAAAPGGCSRFAPSVRPNDVGLGRSSEIKVVSVPFA